MKTSNGSLSRGGMFKTGAAAASAAFVSGSTAAFGQAPAVTTARTFRAWISRGTAPDAPLCARSACVRSPAGKWSCLRGLQPVHSNVGACSGFSRPRPRRLRPLPANAGRDRRHTNTMALIQGHVALASSRRLARRCVEFRWAIACACRGTPQCGAATTACADAPTCASCSDAISPAIWCGCESQRRHAGIFEFAHRRPCRTHVTFEEWVVPVSRRRRPSISAWC
jgi:hypothetical protein